ncbi:rCG41070 [Rattus norvegicus]|uniref:RCG41070 n=1 Tax=Rattus norvegicus TaxID=10116 RepID=A6K266_RAT|nr:rCG41070 [Rattus norvegicus]
MLGGERDVTGTSPQRWLDILLLLLCSPSTGSKIFRIGVGYCCCCCHCCCCS